MEAMAPLVSCLEQADGEEFTLKEAIPMITPGAPRECSSAPVLLARKELMKHLNPQLQSLMKDSDCPTILILGRKQRPNWRLQCH